MDKQRLESILEAYGADPRRWPASEREAALQASARWAEEIGGIEAEARAIDAALARSTEPVVDAALRDRVVAAVSAVDRAATGGTTGPRRGLRPAPRWGLVAGLAAACFGGYSFAALLNADLAARRYETAALAVVQGYDDPTLDVPSPEAHR